MEIRAPYLPYEKLRPIADKFLADYHVTGSIPVPIDNIVEFGFGIQVIPLPGIMDAHDIDASISSDLSTIYVDEFIYLSRPNRYRFSVAHEIAHCVLHEDIFRSLTYSTLAEWKKAIRQIPEDQRGFIEHQAYCFAGLILVPSKQLTIAYETLEDAAAQAGILLKNPSSAERKMVKDHLGRHFHVSPEVIERRMTYDGHWT